MPTVTDQLYDPALGLFKSALRKPQAVDLTDPHAEYKLTLAQDQQEIHDGQGLGTGPLKVPVWGYKGRGVQFASPGPILLTEQNHALSMIWSNGLPAQPEPGRDSIFPFDFDTATLPPVLAGKYQTLKADIITHMHGASVPSGSDGWPTLHYGPGQLRTHHYHNQQPAATLWYHDHAMDHTGLNVYAGTAGGYVILDQTDRVLADYLASLGGNGPGWAEAFGHGQAGLPLVIQDRLLTDDGSRFLYATNYAKAPNDNGITVGGGGEFFGRINLVNGQVSPALEVGPTALRLKLLNGCNSRFLVLAFASVTYESGQASSADLLRLPICRLGDDHGRRDSACVLPGSPIRLGPGERLDIVVDFSRFAGQRIQLIDIGTAPFDGKLPAAFDTALLNAKRNNAGGSDNFPEILAFDVANLPAGAPLDPDILNRILLTGNAVKTRVVALREFVMYCDAMPHDPHMRHYVERCSVKQFNQAHACDAAAMLVLEELEPARPNDPVIVESQFDLFDPGNTPGTFHYRVAGNTAGTIVGKDVTCYVGDMQNAWQAQPYAVRAGSIEVWRFVNLTGDSHPMHIHLTGFRVVESSTVDFYDQGSGIVTKLRVTGGQSAPNLPEHLLGTKDTVQVDPGTVLTVACRFDGGTGRYVYHCHMLEHEDHMMMRKFKVV